MKRALDPDREDHAFTYDDGSVARIVLWIDPYHRVMYHYQLHFQRPCQKLKGFVGSEKTLSVARATAMRLLMRLRNSR